MYNYHVPVLLNETAELLLKNRGSSVSKLYVDCTLGGGGYTEEILKRTPDDVKVLAIDRDINAVEFSKKSLKRYEQRIMIVRGNFANLSDIIKNSRFNNNEMKISGVVLDLGLSSYQLEHEDGFSYLLDTELDMRADKDQILTAKDLLNNSSEKELLRIFRDYGELKYSRQVTRDIISYRHKKRFERTSELVELLKKKIPFRYVNRDLSKVFQALRIAVNNELENLEKVLTDSVLFLESGARIVVVAYHSLEDRIVKNFFRSNEELKVITKKPITPSDEEIEKNSRARSAKLRAAEKISRQEPGLMK